MSTKGMSLAPQAQGEIVRASDRDALESQTRGEVDMQVATAHAYPRNVARARRLAMEMATCDEETAASCYYALPRGGKSIEGPSVRLAEIVASSWGNLRVATRITEIGERFVTAQAVVWDLESNVSKTGEVRRRITNSRGERYNDDMIQQTANAAASIAMRDTLFDVIPQALVKGVYTECRRIAAGDAKSLDASRAACVAHFAKMGAAPQELARLVGKTKAEEIGVEELATLRGLSNAIAQGEASLGDVLADIRKTPIANAGGFGFAPKVPQAEPPHNADTGEVRDEPPAFDGPDVPDFDSGEPVQTAPRNSKPERARKSREPGEEG